LSGGFGTLSFGRQYAPSNTMLRAASSNNVSSVNVSNYYIGTFKTMQTVNGSRWDNSINYLSPNWSGFQLQAIYSFGDQVEDSFGDASRDASKFGIGLKYANDSLYVGTAYQAILKDKGTASGSPGTGKNDAWTIGTSYDFKVVKVFGSYIQEKDKSTATDIETKFFSLGLSVPVSKAGTVMLEVAQIKIEDDKSKGISIGYKHALSKRTTVYTYLGFIDSDEGLGFDRGSAAVTAKLGEKQTGFAFGINHRF
jgi:predicted porin